MSYNYSNQLNQYNYQKTSTSSFVVCSFNTGKNINDFIKTLSLNPNYFHLTTPIDGIASEQFKQLKTLYSQQEDLIAQFIISHAKVICLQEVNHSDRKIVNTLKRSNYTIINFDSLKYDSLIALSNHAFTDIVNFSKKIEISPGFKKDVAIATAKEKVTNKTFAIVSAHVPGFDLFKEPLEEKDTLPGDLYCLDIAKSINDLTVDNTIIGADMNSHPEISRTRFDYFNHQEIKPFIRNISSNYNPLYFHHQSPEYPTPCWNEIDFIFSKKSPDIYYQLHETEFNLVTHASSDHFPIFTKFYLK